MRAVKLGVYGTKMRSVIAHASKEGIAAIAKQQFEIGDQIIGHGLMPILEPEVSIKSPDKQGAEAILLEELTKHLDAAPEGRRYMLKLTIPTVPDLYAPLIKHAKVDRVVALSGGYKRDEACRKLALQSWPHRKLFPRPGRGPDEGHERRVLQQYPWSAAIEEIYDGLHRQGLRRGLPRAGGPGSGNRIGRAALATLAPVGTGPVAAAHDARARRPRASA